jgi:CHASE2 domain-containing sensor protein
MEKLKVSQPPPADRQQFARAFVYIVLLACVSIGSASSGLFSYREATDFASRDIFYRAWGVEYPSERSPRTTTILLSDESLGAGGSWPAPYESHAALLRSLLALQPAAVMIDIGFVDERDDPTIKNLIDILDAYRSRGIRVYLAAAAQASGAQRPIRRDLAALAANGTVSLVSIEMGRDKGRMRTYPLKANDNAHPPAARAIYDDICKTASSPCASLGGDQDFEIWWAARPHPLNCARMLPEQGNCADISSTAFVRFIKLAQTFFAGSNKNLASGELDPVPAPYSPTALWGQVVAGQLSADFKNHIKGSTVFYGLDLALIRDEVYSPVNGERDNRELPGVYYHAMAFDNLVALGPNRIRPDPPWGLSDTGHMALLILLCCVLCLIGRSICIGLNVPGLAPYLDWVIFATTAITAAFIEFAWLHVTPANWIGVMLSQVPMKLADAAGWTEKWLNAFEWMKKWCKCFVNARLVGKSR